MALPIPLTDPIVLQGATLFKQRLLAREANQMVTMTKQWRNVERSLEFAINDLVSELDTFSQNDILITRSKAAKLTRYRELLAQANTQSLKYADWADGFISTGQSEMAGMGLTDGTALIESSYLETFSVGPNFNRLPVGATEFMAGISGDGEPLSNILDKSIVPGVGDKLKIIDTMVASVAQGWAPSKTARLIMNDLSGGLDQAMRISRTEQLRAYRESSRQQYKDSGVVEGYQRLSAKDSRVCPACLIADGTIYKLSTSFEEHPQGRCTLVPIVIGVELPIQRENTGQAWFMKQNPDVQQQILGPGRFAAWRKGEFKLDDLVTRIPNRTWGASLVPTPLKDLVTNG